MNKLSRLLLIDDNPDYRALIRRELRQEFPDLQVTEIRDSQELTQALEVDDFDAVITDYQLHWATGLDILRILKIHNPDCPVIVCTAAGSEEIAVELMKAGVDDYVTKSSAYFVRLPIALRVAWERGEQRKALQAAQAAVVEKNILLEAIVRQARDGIVVTDPQGRLVLVNAAARRKARFNPEGTTLESAPEAWGQAYDADGNLIPPQEWASVRALRDETTLGQEARLIHADGDCCDILISASPVYREDATLLGTVATFTDITERKQAEGALRNSQEQLQTALAIGQIGLWRWLIDADYGILDATCQSLFGLPAGTERVDQTTFLALIHPHDRERLMAAVRRTREQAIPFDLEYRIVRPNDGQVRWLVAKGNRFGDPKAAMMLGATLDITEQKQIEISLHQTQKMEAIGQLTGGIAHDFNNLLTIVLGNLQLLEIPLKGQPPLDKQIRTAQQAARRGAELVRQLLAYSRRQALEPKTVDLNHLLAEMLTFLHQTLGEAIEIKLLSGQDLWYAVADPHQLETALLNLALNARDAMPQGGTLALETANVSLDTATAVRAGELRQGDYVMLAVSDTGSGMSAAVSERAFEPFFTTKAIGYGSGLGLSMVYGFAKQSKGHVTLYSEPGLGTTVKLYLPRASEGAEKTSTRDPFAFVSSGGSETLLVVEDDKGVLELVANFLTSVGYTVLEAPHGPAALALLEKNPHIDLLFTDVVMPGGMSGVELAREARCRCPNLKVLYTSGYTEHTLVHQGQIEEGTVLLNKPYQLETLAGKVRSALNGKSGSDEPGKT